MRKFLLLFLIIGIAITSKATHFQGGFLQYECLGDNVYKFSYYWYRDCSGASTPSNLSINIYSDLCDINMSLPLPLVDDFLTDAEREVTDLQCGTTTCNGGSLQGTALYVYENTVTLPAYCSDWLFTYEDCCRNSNITTPVDGSDASFYHFATLDNSTGLCNSTPVLPGGSTPVPGLCAGNLWEYNFGAVDFDGDSLVYSLVAPVYDASTIATYAAPLSAIYPIETEQGFILFDSSTGIIIGQPKLGLAQFAVISVLIEEYRNGVLIASQIRDYQVIVETNCTDADAAIGENPLSENDVFNASYNPLDSSISACIDQEFSFNFTFNDTSLSPPPGYDITSNIKLLGYLESELITTVNGTTISGTVTITVAPSDTGLQYLEITVTNQTDTCFIESAMFSFPIKIVPGLVLDDPILGDSLFYCNTGDSITLPGNDAGKVKWFNLKGGYPNGFSTDTVNHPLAAPSETTHYIGVAEELKQCINRDTITILVLPVFDLPDTIFSCLDDSLVIAPTWMLNDTTALLFYKWFDKSKDSLIFKEERTQTEDSSAYFGVTITDSTSGCIVKDSSWVSFIQCFLAIPNIFTPNGDGMNDIFEIKHFDNGKWDLTIFNRWGKKVFYESPYSNIWDGEDLTDGMYFYHLSHQELKLEYKGWIQINR